MLTFIAFAVLLLFTVVNPRSRQQLRHKTRDSWILDISGLWVQGLLIPWLQIAVLYRGYQWLLPHWQDSLTLHPLLGFLLSFVVVDYLYYWNHRLLHSRPLWLIHRVHHTVTDMDVLGTSRNTLWSSLFILYVWIHSLMILGLAHPAGYIFGVSLSNMLDLWRHSEAHPPTWISCWLSPWLILPQDHAWHHSPTHCHQNFGANLKLWDWLHKTVNSRSETPDQLGIPLSLSLTRQLLLPR